MTLWDWLFHRQGELRQKEQVVRSLETVVNSEMRVLEEVKQTNVEAHDQLRDLIHEMRRRHTDEERRS